jgi:hypothetical protein
MHAYAPKIARLFQVFQVFHTLGKEQEKKKTQDALMPTTMILPGSRIMSKLAAQTSQRQFASAGDCFNAISRI